MRLYPGFTDVPTILAMPAITFLALLNEANKLEVYELKNRLMVSAYPHTEEDNRKEIHDSLTLPDDLVDSILGEDYDDVTTLKDTINGN